MADDQNEKPQVVRFPEPGVEPAREAEERRVAEIAREIEELGRALEGPDRPARFGTAPAQARKSAGGAEDCSTPEPKPLPTVADMSSAPNEVSPQVGKFATIPASPQDRKLVAEGGPPTRRRKWGPSLAAVIIGLTARKNAETESASRKAAEEKALAEEAERKAAEEKLAAVAAERREEARQVAEEKARAEAARQIVEAEAQAAV